MLPKMGGVGKPKLNPILKLEKEARFFWLLFLAETIFMKYLKIFAILWISISCTKGKLENEYQSLNYSLDTVRINSNGKNLDLTRFLAISDLDNERNSIFSYNEFDHSVDELDLNTLSFAKKYSFEKEGPNGTGEYFYTFNVMKDCRFFIMSYEKSSIFDCNGSLKQGLDWINSKDLGGAIYGEIPRNQVFVESNELKVFGLGYDNIEKEVYLDMLSIEDDTFKRFNLNSKKSYADLILAIENTSIFIDPEVYLKYENNTIIVSYEFSNEIVLFDPKEDFLKFIDYNPKKTPKIVKSMNGINIASREQMQKEFQSFLEQVKYYPPVWDSLNKQYLRLSSTRVFHEIDNDLALVPKTKEIKNYLSVFDAEFNLINELEIPDLSYTQGLYFAKNGSLWVFINLDDEMGFVRINLSK
ncbi:DUF4221 family protein [Cognataquiflexum aquatile]|uniref:DUF4221 family protein n=1 Tax=Cognataquiflexum aquatile TaxID=2249427 RepID=UPI001E374D12|nr:DUF4221 family protein [Cognataquiflexum aquatile]